ncbi:cyclopropane-fatty-acyl-phospholipid synthase family protein [Streptomyces sp. P38-E01]|uniref:Cyclopropane-fatty-acyl-phospholipid synthase family protein n=1 Tax=Streptomyces tardus TaxID=2780544 RepID=A0A949JKW4_9ACTN|nr:cyclopropane-fatty-acyl-phospholipid synthase family protein [Streptomyces tardus]MBU7600600.1 cyclopropane-fatty-acyl-phospholipid synthase family protein [Streptomyces tardus]
MSGAAPQITRLVGELLGGPLPVRLRAWDGSESGPADAPVLVLRHRRALRHLVWQPDELGLARAYISGDLAVEGDLAEGLRAVWGAVREGGLRPPTARSLVRDRTGIRAARTALRLGALGPRPPRPRTEARPEGALHSKSRDEAVIAHHYDLSNDFYGLLLDPTMAYSCAHWAREPGSRAVREDGTAGAYGLHDAQRAKLDLICRRLALAPGMRLLDVGCGWGSLTLYAAECYGVRVTAVTLAAEQAAHVRRQAAERGLEELVEVRRLDYRDLTGDGSYDAVATVEMGEHVGDAEYPAFAALLHRMLRPRGRLLVQQMSRGSVAPGGGAFIEAYIAPDMHMRPVGDTVTLLENAGLEVREVQSMREDYVHTVRAWYRTLQERWSEVVDLVGEETARVWQLYLVGGALAFEERRMGVDQLLAVRPTAGGESGFAESAADRFGAQRVAA